MYDHILVPVDGSETAIEAVETAGVLARAHDATLELLYVRETAGGAEPNRAMFVKEVTDTGEQAVALASERATATGVEHVERSIERGRPVERILLTADRTNADLLVMGTHGRSGLSRVLLGSVTESVLRDSPVPVLAVPTDETPPTVE